MIWGQTLDELLAFQPPPSVPLSFRHMSCVYQLDHDKKAHITLQHLLVFFDLCLEKKSNFPIHEYRVSSLSLLSLSRSCASSSSFGSACRISCTTTRTRTITIRRRPPIATHVVLISGRHGILGQERPIPRHLSFPGNPPGNPPGKNPTCPKWHTSRNLWFSHIFLTNKKKKKKKKSLLCVRV